MANLSLVSDTLLSSPAFVRDMTSFLKLSEDALFAISKFGSEPEGFVGHSQGQRLSALCDIPIGQAMGDLRVAKYLYDRVTELGLDVTDAISQIDSIGSTFEPSVAIGVQKRKAIEAILSFKRDYEISNADRKAIANGPHFGDLDGVWGMKLFQTREGEAVKVPVMTLNLSWHDGVGDHHEVFLQLSDKDWDDFSNRVKGFSARRAYLNEFL